AGEWMSFLSAAVSILLCVISVWGWPLITTGRVKKILSYFVLAAVVNLVVSIAATYWLGPIGPPIGGLANLAGIALWCLPRIVEREFGTSRWKLLAAAAWPWLLAVPYTALWALVAAQVDLQAL